MENNELLRNAAELASHEAKRTFEFADKLQYFYHLTNDKSPEQVGPSTINITLLEFLGKGRYEKLCEKWAGYAHWFKPEFANNPVRTEDIVFDCQFRNHYSLSQLMDAVKSVL